ncbi:MAG: glycosyltransferase [Pyrinomonadaceae bacterium]|nr:glycosyltransferase [Pyrinomonadaceae bacterium]
MSINKCVSIIIPTFNRANLLPLAIESVQNQTYPNIQIIVVDDGSTDNTAQIVSEFDKVEYYYQENKRQGAARNLGLSKATGDYIASLDSDDVWHPNFLQEAISNLEKNDLDFVFLNWIYHIDSVEFKSDWYRSRIWKKYRKNPLGDWFLLNPAETRRLFIETCPAPSSGLLVKKESLLSNWNEQMLIADDWCLILDMVLQKECKAGFTLKPFWVKGIQDENIYDGREPIETVKELGLHDELMLVERFEDLLTTSEKKIFRKRRAGHHFNLGFWDLRKRGLSKKALKLMLESFKISPFGMFALLQKRVQNRIYNNFTERRLLNPTEELNPDLP